MDSPPGNHRLLLEAASFAARAHKFQMRKDGQTPYVAHPFRVCLVVRHVFGIDDPNFLLAALLHDTIEDTTTDFDDLAERFGPNVARRVGELSKDMRLPDERREEAYMATLAAADPVVKVVKLADIFDNLTDSQHLSGKSRERTMERSRKYLAAIEKDLPAESVKPLQMVRLVLDQMQTDVRA